MVVGEYVVLYRSCRGTTRDKMQLKASKNSSGNASKTTRCQLERLQISGNHNRKGNGIRPAAAISSF